MKAYKLRFFGRVQRVGFRRIALDLAQELNLTGYAKNLPDGSLEILIQGEEESLKKFLESIKKPPPQVKIKEVKEEELKYDISIKEFKIIYGDLAEELQEGFGAMHTFFLDYWDDFKSFREEFRDYRNDFRDYREEFRDYAKRTDENFKILMEKYSEISDKLTIILETLIKESKETREMLNDSIKLLKQALDKLANRD